MKYRAEIDGLRALAVVPVILFHSGFELFSGGYVGVDVFFVISGYLITTILIEDIEKKRFSIINFYERRARRILPALFFVTLICIPFAWMWSFNQQYREFSQSLIAVSVFASNIFFLKKADYFSTDSEEKPLLHTWSLSVEEQYYLLFPIFLIFAWRFGRNRVFWLVVIMATISLVLSEWGWRRAPISNFYLAPNRAWELLSGSITAFIIKKNGAKKNEFVALLGLALISFSIFAYDEQTPFPSIYTLVPVLGVVLLVLYADKQTLAARVLSSRIFVGIGLISYSAYLWHQPILGFTRWRNFGGELSFTLTILTIVLTLLLAYLTYHFIEKPIRYKYFLSSQKSIFVFSAIGMIIFISIGLHGHFYYSIGDKKQPSFIQNIVPYNEYQADNYFLISESWGLQKKINGINFFAVDNIKKDRDLLFPINSNKKNLLIVGNSHSVDFFNVLSYSEKLAPVFNLARFGIQISEIDDDFYNIPNYRSSDVIILCSLMSDKDLDALLVIAERIILDDKKLIICQNIFTWMKRDNYTKLDRMVIEGALSKTSSVDLSEQINQKYTLDYQNLNFINNDNKKTYLKMKSHLATMSSKLGFSVIDRMSYVCANSGCKIVSSDIGKYFFDLGHHTILGAKYFASVIDRNGFAEKIIGN